MAEAIAVIKAERTATMIATYPVRIITDSFVSFTEKEWGYAFSASSRWLYELKLTTGNTRFI